MTSQFHASAMDDLWQQIADSSPKNGYGMTVDVSDFSSEYSRREEFLEKFGFAVPTLVAIQAIQEFVDGRGVLEVGAGTGIWARLLSDAGVKVTAADNRSTKYSLSMRVGTYYDVQKMGAVAAVKRYRSHAALMLCWPDYNGPMAATCLAAFQGDRVIYIGEGSGGCTGDDRFHGMLRRWHEVRAVPIPQWPGIHDELTLYERMPS